MVITPTSSIQCMASNRKSHLFVTHALTGVLRAFALSAVQRNMTTVFPCTKQVYTRRLAHE
jgi:hypothetical protein